MSHAVFTIRSSMSFPSSFAAAVRWAVHAVCAVGFLSACSSGTPVPPCPQVRFDSTTSTLTKFRGGSGHTFSDVEYEVRFLGYEGVCDFNDDGVDVIMDIVMEVASGPAAKSGRIPIYYFVAVPQYYPKPAGKKIISVKHDLKAGTGRRAQVEENGVRVSLPLDSGEPAAAYEVYVGLQLTQDQLDYNRSLQAR